MRMRSTLGAPAGGRSWRIGGNLVAGSFASNVVRPTGVTSGIGSTCRWTFDASGVFGVLSAIEFLRRICIHSAVQLSLAGMDVAARADRQHAVPHARDAGGATSKGMAAPRN